MLHMGDGMLEARYAPGTSSLILAIGLGAIALNILLYLFSSSHHLMLWVTGAAAVGLGMRSLDRRVKSDRVRWASLCALGKATDLLERV